LSDSQQSKINKKPKLNSTVAKYGFTGRSLSSKETRQEHSSRLAVFEITPSLRNKQEVQQ
jgi:hypothetical protein